MVRRIALVLAGLVVSAAPTTARGSELHSNDHRMSAMKEARGHFTVQMKPEAELEGGIGRFSLTKSFTGALQGTSTGEMLAVRTPTRGSAGYVLIEHVTATLDGRSGSFLLQHAGLMDRGHPDLRVEVIPDSGTAGLTGLKGDMSIDAADNHAYLFRYTLPDAGD